MPGEDIYSWSTTAANNSSADSLIDWSEGMPRASVNNSSRSEMAAHAKQRDLTNGSIVTTGTANAQAFTSGVGYSGTIPTGLLVLLKIGPALTNNASCTLDMDAIGAVVIKKQAGTDLGGGELIAGTYAEFRYDGTNWILLRSGGSVISRVTMQTFTASGTYTPTVGMISCIIECVGGGGGGGGAAATVGYLSGGGGGGAGGYARSVKNAAQVGASQVVTIGAGGGPGANGSNTSVGSLCIGTGGGAGTTGDNSNIGQGGVGGSGSGDVVFPGGQGADAGYAAGLDFGISINISTGRGGASRWGDGGKAAVASGGTSTPGSTGIAYGGGGGGASSLQNPSGILSNGGAGAAGAVVITEFVAL
jgi:hypothetical protein